MNKLNGIDIVTGEILITSEGVNVDDYYKFASENLENYFIEQEEPKNRLDAVDIAMRTVLIPHHKEIINLKKKIAMLERKIEKQTE